MQGLRNKRGMKIKLKLSTLLRQLGALEDKSETLEIAVDEGTTPIECVRNVVEQFPSLRNWVYEKDGGLRKIIFLFVNGEKLLPDDLSNPLKEGDELFVVLSFAGG